MVLPAGRSTQGQPITMAAIGWLLDRHASSRQSDRGRQNPLRSQSGQSVGRSVGQSVSLLVSRSVSQSVGQVVNSRRASLGEN